MLQIRVPLRVLFVRVPYYIGDLKRGPEFGELPTSLAGAPSGHAQGLPPKEHPASACKWQSQIGLGLSTSLEQAMGSFCSPHQEARAKWKSGFSAQLGSSARPRARPRSIGTEASAKACGASNSWRETKPKHIMTEKLCVAAGLRLAATN